MSVSQTEGEDPTTLSLAEIKRRFNESMKEKEQ
jgi:hypothetical protein